jgi:hypothetical protein
VGMASLIAIPTGWTKRMSIAKRSAMIGVFGCFDPLLAPLRSDSRFQTSVAPDRPTPVTVLGSVGDDAKASLAIDNSRPVRPDLAVVDAANALATLLFRLRATERSPGPKRETHR